MSGRVQRRQAARWDQQDQQQYEQQQYEQQQYAAQPAPAPAEDDPTAQLEKYAKLHAQGVLTDEEFASAKAKILGI